MKDLNYTELFALMLAESFEEVAEEAKSEGEKWKKSVRELTSLLLKTFDKEKKAFKGKISKTRLYSEVDATLDAYIKRIIKNMLNINIMKRNAYLKTDKLTLMISYTNGEQETIDVTLDMVDDFSFDCVNPYKEADMEKILANKKMMENKKK